METREALPAELARLSRQANAGLSMLGFETRKRLRALEDETAMEITPEDFYVIMTKKTFP